MKTFTFTEEGLLEIGIRFASAGFSCSAEGFNAEYGTLTAQGEKRRDEAIREVSSLVAESVSTANDFVSYRLSEDARKIFEHVFENLKESRSYRTWICAEIKQVSRDMGRSLLGEFLTGLIGLRLDEFEDMECWIVQNVPSSAHLWDNIIPISNMARLAWVERILEKGEL